MDFITRENVVLHETIWHKLAEKNLYKMLKELRYTDEMFINYQKNRFKKCSVFLIVGVILSFIQPYLILAGIALALLQWTNEYKRVKRIYNNSLFQKQLTFSKFTRMLIPYLLQSNSTLYNVFNKMLLRLEEGYVKVAYIDYSGNVMSRYFMPTVSKGKYFSESYKDIIGSKKLILTSLIETETNIEELEQLENLIRKKKEELKE